MAEMVADAELRLAAAGAGDGREINFWFTKSPQRCGMSQSIAPPDGIAGIQAALRRASSATGVDFSLLIETARRESALDPNARAGTSSATGLFQFIESTWFDMVRRHGAEHGLGNYANALNNGTADSAMKREILALRTDPEISARMAGELTRENASVLRAHIGRAPNAGELYAAHVMGAGGALKLIDAAQQGVADASALFPREAAANRGLFYAGGAARSASGVLERLGLEAGASFAQQGEGGKRWFGSMTPALAQALFEIAGLPLISAEAEDASERHSAIAAYSRSKA